MLLFVSAVCYSSLWLLARYGGEWATSGDIPVPDNSQLVNVTYEDGFYAEKHSLYLHHASPEELRGWYLVEAHIGLTPIALNMEKTRFIDNPDFYMQSPTFHQSTFISQFQQISATYMTGWFAEMMPDCQRVHIYKNHEAAVRDFPDQILPEDTTVFVISTCWPNVNRG